MNASKFISLVSSILVFALAVVSFVLSYDNLRGLAQMTGAVSPGLAWLWPFIVDGALVVFSLAVLRNSLHGERALWPFALVILFSALSVALNVSHAPANLLARIIASIAPVALLLSFETLMTQLKSEVRRAGAAMTMLAMNEAVTLAQAEVSQLNAQADDLTAKLAQLKTEIDQARKEKRAARANDPARDPDNGHFTQGNLSLLETANEVRFENVDQRRAHVLATLRHNSQLTYDQLAQTTGASIGTVKRDVYALIEQGKVRRNGRGLEVVNLETLPAAQLEAQPSAN